MSSYLISLSLYLNIDPKSRAEIHISLCNKYLSDAEARISEDDHVQASEKGWGAASQAVKAVALKDVKEFMSRLKEIIQDL